MNATERIKVKLRPPAPLTPALRPATVLEAGVNSRGILPANLLVERQLLADLQVGATSGAAQRPKVLLLDSSRPVAFAGFSDHIVRLDYSSYPPLQARADVRDLAASWPDRANLIYN